MGDWSAEGRNWQVPGRSGPRAQSIPPSGGVGESGSRLRQNLIHDPSLVGGTNQPLVQPLVPVVEAVRVQPELMQQGRLKIADADRIRDGVIAKLIRLAKCQASPDSPPPPTTWCRRMDGGHVPRIPF